MHGDPILQFQTWFDEVLEAGILQPDAMVLATVSPKGRTSARVVLLKGFDDRGFTFFTNYESRKGRDLRATRSRPWSSSGPPWSGRSGSRGGSSGSPSRSRKPTSRAGREGRGSGPGAHARARSCPAARSSRTGSWNSRGAIQTARSSPAALGRLPGDPRRHRVLARPPNRLHDRLLYRARRAGAGGSSGSRRDGWVSSGRESLEGPDMGASSTS